MVFQSHTIFSGKWLFSTRKTLANEHEVGGSCSMTMHLRTAFKNRLSRNDASVNFLQGVSDLNTLVLFVINQIS